MDDHNAFGGEILLTFGEDTAVDDDVADGSAALAGRGKQAGTVDSPSSFIGLPGQIPNRNGISRDVPAKGDKLAIALLFCCRKRQIVDERVDGNRG